MIVERLNGIDHYHRVMTDNQGSIMYVGEEGGDEYYFNYDAWGRHRDILTTNYISSPSKPSWFNRGYTGHEHLDRFQIINMNGRLYDPVIGRMMSPDNNLQSLYNSQSYNRYTYAFNNPLRYTDPDGELAITVSIAIGAAIGVLTNGANNVIHHRSFFDGAGKAALFGAIGGGISSAIGGVASGAFPSGAILTAGEKISIAAFQVVAHSWTSAVFSMAEGSDPLTGFYAGGVSSVVSSGIGSLGGGATAVIIGGGLSGGIGAKLTGGNFWDGASQGLITAGLNHAAHTLLQCDPPKKIDFKKKLKQLESWGKNFLMSPAVPTLETGVGVSMTNVVKKLNTPHNGMGFVGTSAVHRSGFVFHVFLIFLLIIRQNYYL